MAWSTPKSINKGTFISENKLMPANTTPTYSSAFQVPIDSDRNNRWISVLCSCSAVTGTNIDIAIYGAMTETGTKFLLKDAVVADVTNGVAQGAVLDINAYPAPYYFIQYTADADESANTMTTSIFF